MSEENSGTSRRKWIWVGVVGLVLFAIALVVVVLLMGGETDVARRSLVYQCRARSGEVFALPSPDAGAVVDPAESDFRVQAEAWDEAQPGGTPRERGWDRVADLDDAACESLALVARLDGSPPPASTYGGGPFGWYLVSYSGGEGWMYLAPYTHDDQVHDGEIRERLSELPVATFPSGTGSSDLASDLTDWSRVGETCTGPGGGGWYSADRYVRVTNVGEGVGPAEFQVGFGEYLGDALRIDHVSTIHLYRGLEPGESLEMGPFWSVVIVIDPEGLLGDPDTGNNTVFVPSDRLACG